MTLGSFYGKFDRHANGAGIKGHSTHYCPGCGHGLAHKYLAEAIEDLGIQDRTVAVSPVSTLIWSTASRLPFLPHRRPRVYW